jgi:hypothetical protein
MEVRERDTFFPFPDSSFFKWIFYWWCLSLFFHGHLISILRLLTFWGPQRKTHNRSQKADAECGQYKPTGSFFSRVSRTYRSSRWERRICISLYTVHLLLSDNENVSQCAIIVCSTNYLMVKKCQGINGRRGAHRIRKNPFNKYLNKSQPDMFDQIVKISFILWLHMERRGHKIGFFFLLRLSSIERPFSPAKFLYYDLL